MFLKDIKGFKYPDIELVRWFFKAGLDKLKNAKVLEFASHNGNNLSLFAGYDYECVGVELDEKNHLNALYNFSQVYKYEKCEFFHQNMLEFAKTQKNINADVLLIPNVINYITKDEFSTLLQDCVKNSLFKQGGGALAHFFLRARSVKDHRYGLGKNLHNGSFLLDRDEFSGEKDCICTAYQDYELVELCQKYLNLYDFELITSENINVKNHIFIKDSDIILYGKIRS